MVAIVDVVAQRDGDRARIVPSGRFVLEHATAAARAIADVEPALSGCLIVDVDLSGVSSLDGAGAVQLARFVDRLEAAGPRARLVQNSNPEAERLIALYRGRRSSAPPPPSGVSSLARLGLAATEAPGYITGALDFVGQNARALPGAIASPGSVDWRSLPRLVQSIGADGLFVTSAASLLVGVIIASLGVSELARFGATIYVPELVVVAQFRELGPLVTAIVVAGRSGAGLASEIATMKVSEEIDALRAMGFDPVRWLVVPRCLALIIAMPLLTWIGNALALVGGLVATLALTSMSAHAYFVETADTITLNHLLAGLIKTPFLALAIGLVACGQGLATHGGAAAVGTRTTSAVVLSILAAITISSLFTVIFAVLGI